MMCKLSETFFRLVDDLHIPKRWHLGEITCRGGSEPDLANGFPYCSQAPLSVEIIRQGQALDFALTSFNVPIVRDTLSKVMKAIAQSDCEVIPITLPNHDGFVALNATRLLECVDEQQSEYVKWTKDDYRSDLAGEFRQVTKLLLVYARIPKDVHFFRLKGWEVALIVSGRLKSAMEDTGCLGAKFLEV